MAEAGRPTDFKPEYVAQAQKLAVLGATDDEIADFFGKSTRTVYRWKLQHEEFCQALKVGKELADDRVERSMYAQSLGYYVVEQQALKIKVNQYEERVEIVDVERYVPPNTTAGIFWLKNRRKDEWRDRQEHHHTHEVAQRSDEELEAEYVELADTPAALPAPDAYPAAIDAEIEAHSFEDLA